MFVYVLFRPYLTQAMSVWLAYLAVSGVLRSEKNPETRKSKQINKLRNKQRKKKKKEQKSQAALLAEQTN